MLEPRVLVVVSYYDARPMAELDRLLHSLRTTPAGWPFDVRVVVNRDGDGPLGIAERHPGVEVLCRANAGYNIGAWEHGWRADPAYDAYLFLQHECVLQGENWLTPFVERAAEPGIGLVGERINPAWDTTWDEIERRFAGHALPDHRIDGRPAERLPTYFHFFARHGIDRGPRGDHLQTLVLFARRTTLEAIGGFPCGSDYGEAIAAEISISKKVQAKGLAIREVGERPFRHVTHPQWSKHPHGKRAREPRLGLDRWLRECREEHRFADKPWLLLGKGPTFAHLTAAHREAFHLFGLNHVVREVPLTIAHAIDIDVVASCSASLRDNCHFLLMPRVPHVDSAPGERALEEWFDSMPVLDEMDRQGRLVWYNASTARARAGSPVIEVRHFSSEAAMQLLGRMGAKTVRSLGIDGGRGYSTSFADLADTTRLANGQPLFDRQFEHLAAIVAQNHIDYAPLTAPLRIAIDGGRALPLAAHVLEYSIRKHASFPVEILHLDAGASPPPDTIRLPATAVVDGDMATMRDRPEALPSLLTDLANARPWSHPDRPDAEPWLDLFAEAVNAGVVTPTLVRRAVRRGEASPQLLRLPMPRRDATTDPLAARARELGRELANMRLSRTFQIGQCLVGAARAVRRRLGH